MLDSQFDVSKEYVFHGNVLFSGDRRITGMGGMAGGVTVVVTVGGFVIVALALGCEYVVVVVA